MGGEGFGFCVRRKGTGSQVMEAKRNGPGEKKKSWASRGQKGFSGARRQQASRYVLKVGTQWHFHTKILVPTGRHWLALTTGRWATQACKGKKRVLAGPNRSGIRPVRPVTEDGYVIVVGL